jgi:pimeloyl-ACP methyl ester carboxylesterase
MHPISDRGDLKQVELPQGVVRYRDIGSGPPIVFVHGFLVNGELWRKIVPALATEFRCIAPDFPLGGHQPAMRADADLTPPGQAGIVADFLAALDLRDVTLVGNDTGGGICQIVVARHPERIGRLVLTNCDAFENFPPALLKPLVIGARLPGFDRFLGRLMRSRLVQRGLYALVARRFPEPPVARSYFAPAADPGVQRDVVKLLRSVSNRHTLDAARAFPGFTKPVLIVWGLDDKLLFPLRYGERLRDAFPHARLETVAGSRTFISEDQPDRLAALIAAFLREPTAAAA